MRDLKVKFFIGLSTTFLLFLMNFVAAADPLVNDITIDPQNPEPVSDITITADISSKNISKVNLTISACNDDICFSDLTQKVEMTLNSEGNYQAQITLNDSEGKANNIKYLFEITLDNGTEYRLSDPSSWKTYLNLVTNDDKDANGSEDGGIPGFEFVFVLVALYINTLFYYKKR